MARMVRISSFFLAKKDFISDIGFLFTLVLTPADHPLFCFGLIFGLVPVSRGFLGSSLVPFKVSLVCGVVVGGSFPLYMLGVGWFCGGVVVVVGVVGGGLVCWNCGFGWFLARKFVVGLELLVFALLFTPDGFLDICVVGTGCFVGGGLAGFGVVGWVVGSCGKCGLDFGLSRLLMMVLMPWGSLS